MPLTPNDTVPPTAPVTFTGCAVMLIVLCINALAVLLVTLAAPAAVKLHR